MCLAIGVDWCAVFTDLYYIRIFSLFGTEKMVISSIGSVLTMTGYENYLALIYISGVPLYGNQNLRFRILDANKNFDEIFDGNLPLSPFSKLQNFCYSEGKLIDK